MKKILLVFCFSFTSVFFAACPEVLDHDLRVLASKEVKNLCDYENKVILAVNVASRCGYTYQYKALQNLYQNLLDREFVILGFPSRDFMFQEYKDESKVKEFCSTEYGVTFPMFATSSVKGKKANKFFKELIKKTGEEPGWNFHKYLIGKDGTIIDSFATVTGPGSNKIIKKIDELLNSSS